MSAILGVNGLGSRLGRIAYPFDKDGGAALIVDDRVVAAVEQERLSRRRHAVEECPTNAIAEVLGIANLTMGDIDQVAFPWHPSLLNVSRYELEAAILESLPHDGYSKTPEVVFVPHHTAHAFSGLAF